MNDNEMKNTTLLQNVTIAEEEFDYNVKEENNFTMESGAEIKIPAEAFVDINGNKIKGNVKVTYKEIKTAADMIISNIDMKYDSAGVTYDFQTAGMFDINAHADGKPIFLDKGHEITVTYNSEIKGDYNFYRYNDDKNWTHETASEDIPQTILNDKIIDVKYNIAKPVKLNPNKDLVIEVPIDYKHIDELKIYSNIIWKYVGEKSIGEIAGLLKKRINRQVLEKSDKKGKYNLNFRIGKKEHNLLVRPVFAGKSFKKAMKRFNAAISSNQENNEQTAKVRRKSNVSELGLHNYDRIYHRPEAIFVKADFKIKGNDALHYDIENVHIFHVTGKDNVIVKQRNGNKMHFSKLMNNKLIAILPGNNVAVMSAADFKKKHNKISPGKKTTFELEISETIIETPDDLDKLISSLQLRKPNLINESLEVNEMIIKQLNNFLVSLNII